MSLPKNQMEHVFGTERHKDNILSITSTCRILLPLSWVWCRFKNPLFTPSTVNFGLTFDKCTLGNLDDIWLHPWPSAVTRDPCWRYADILGPLDVMKPIIEEDVGLDLGENGAFGSPIHEEGLIDCQPPFTKGFDGTDAHVTAATGSHQVSANRGILLAELLTHLPKMHGKCLQWTLESTQELMVWEWMKRR